MAKLSPRQFRLDLIRLLAVLGVMGIHLMHPVFSRPDFQGGLSWWFATLIHTLSLVSVPLLIMISGQLLLPKSETISQNFHRTFRRLIIPLLIWTPILFYWSNHHTHFHYTLTDLIDLIMSGNLFHLYFLVILIGLYLLLPLLRSINAASAEHHRYILILAWIAGICVNFFNYSGLTSTTSFHLFTWWLPYLGYFLTGPFLAQFHITPKDQHLLGIGFLLWFTATIILSYLGVDLVGHHTNILWLSGTFYFNSFLAPNIIFLSIAAYLLLLHARLPYAINFNWLSRPIGLLAQATYGVFIIHPLIIRWVDIRLGYAIEFVNTTLWPFLLTRSIIVISLSFIIAHLLRHLPFLKKAVGE